MTQSANARPCNCDQALKAERDLVSSRAKYDLFKEAALRKSSVQAQKLAAVERILCDLVSAPSLSVAQFNDPTLERIRLAMLGRAE